MSVLNIVSVAIGIIGVIYGIYQGVHNTGSHDGSLVSDVGYIKGGVDDIKRKQEKQDEQHILVVERLASVESSAKQAHHRIDALEEKVER